MMKIGEQKRRQYGWVVWYSFCTLLLGVIDQRRGSAVGDVQILFANLVCVVFFFFLLPSMKKAFFRRKETIIQAVICGIFLLVFRALASGFIKDPGLWITAPLNIICISFLIAYIWWDRKETLGNIDLIKGGYILLMLSLFLMLLSVNKTIWPGLYLLFFGCFYLIGISVEQREQCVLGVLLGLALWFVFQQGLAYVFRPYDYVRYKGLYGGETQNGLFYMIAFCAFTGLVLYGMYRGVRSHWLILLFLISCGCISLLLLTGGKCSLLGAILGGSIGYLLFGVKIKKSLRYLGVQCVALAICSVLLFPAAYGSVRYFPTILHHPIWFEGEYNEKTSVHSFDPWDSERYISFDTALQGSLGRILEGVGIRIEKKEGQWRIQTPLSIQVDAAGSGNSADDPYLEPEEEDRGGGDPIRVALWKFFIKNLNFEGHNGLTFYYRPDVVFRDAHNIFLQVAVFYGIIPGILFMIWNVWCMIRLVKRNDITGCVASSFMVAIMGYGMFEQAINTGQITLALLFLLYYFGLEKTDRS